MLNKNTLINCLFSVKLDIKKMRNHKARIKTNGAENDLNLTIETESEMPSMRIINILNKRFTLYYLPLGILKEVCYSNLFYNYGINILNSIIDDCQKKYCIFRIYSN